MHIFTHIYSTHHINKATFFHSGFKSPGNDADGRCSRQLDSASQEDSMERAMKNRELGNQST